MLLATENGFGGSYGVCTVMALLFQVTKPVKKLLAAKETEVNVFYLSW